VVDPQPRRHPGAEVVVDDIGGADEAQEGGLAGGVLQVQRERQLVALERMAEAVGIGHRRARRARRQRRRGARRDPDHLGPERGEDVRAERPGHHGREVEHTQPGKRKGGSFCHSVRAISIFMISELPPAMRRTRASTYIRAIGVSAM
jgi:hypothetical protein